MQLCLVHLVRYSVNFVGHKERKAVAAGLMTIYHAPTEETAQQPLEQFAQDWGEKYPLIVKKRAAFPSKEAAYKLLYLAWQNIQKQ